MKLALAIVLCIGLYLCAVSATDGEDEDEIEMNGGTANAIKYPDFYKDFFVNFDEHKNLVEKYTSFKVTQGSPGFDRYIKWINDKYRIFLRKCKSYTYVQEGKYHLLKSSWDNLKKADAEFKKKCVFAYQETFDQDSSMNWSSDEEIMVEKAFPVFDLQLEQFIDELQNSGVGGDEKGELQKFLKSKEKFLELRISPDCADQLKEFVGSYNFLEFFGYWFKPDCDPDDMNKAIQEMKGEHNLDNDKAAKVMVLLKKFKDGKKDNHYLPKPSLTRKMSKLWFKEAK